MRDHPRPGPAWSDLQPLVAAALGAVAVVLGYFGFREAEPGYSASDAIFATVQLFVLQGSVPENGTPWELNVARFLAPALVGYAGLQAALAIARDRALRWRVRLFGRGHAVVVGLTDTGYAVATRLADQGEMVAVVAPDASVPRVASCVQRGIAVIPGDPGDAAVLRQARPERAANVVIAPGDDSLALRALAACEQATRAGRRLPAMHVELARTRLWSELHQVALQRSDRPGIEFFCTPDRQARALLDAAASDLIARHDGVTRLLVCGEGDVIPRVIIHAVRRIRSLGGSLSIMITGPHAERELKAALDDASWLAHVADLRAEPSNPADSDAQTAVVCGLGDADALAAAAALDAALRSSEARVWVAVSDPALAKALDETRLDLRRVRLVAATAVALGPALLAESAVELISRAKHDDYVARERRRGITPQDNPSLVSWDLLPASLRMANIRFAESVASKLATIGAALAPLDSAGVDEDLKLDPAELDDLARAEHERWMEDLLDEGWRPTTGPKDPVRKLHPLLVPWDDLDEAEREKDRDGMRSLPGLLACAGYRIIR